MKNLIKKLLGFKEYSMLIDVSLWLTEQIKSTVRKNVPYSSSLAGLRSRINFEFGVTLTINQIVNIFFLTKKNLKDYNIEILADNLKVVANYSFGV